jgi:LAO/AO transport system kinase
MKLEPHIFEKLKKKDKRIISRLISKVESNEENSLSILNEIYRLGGNAYKIGITGPPGAGKSTLTNQITKMLIDQNKTVGIIAVDPTSPFTGGALLGDRVRMNEIGMHPNVFIRSMATRGSLGGLSKKAIDASDVLDAADFDYIIFETVGVGQSELDIAKTADTTMVVLVPESGDSIQAMKAGLMEIADFFVLNKSDRPGADNAVMSIRTILQLNSIRDSEWELEIIKAVAHQNQGVSEILDEIFKHRTYLETSGKIFERRLRNNKIRIRNIVDNELRIEMWNNTREEFLNAETPNVVERVMSPFVLAEKLIENYKTEKITIN